MLTVARTEETLTLRLKGVWDIAHVPEIEAALANVPTAPVAAVTIDSSDLQVMDLSAAWLLRARVRALVSEQGMLRAVGPYAAHFEFLNDVSERAEPTTPFADTSTPALTGAVAWIGRSSVRSVQEGRHSIAFFGRIGTTVARALWRPKQLRLPSVTRHVYETGIQAIPIVSLIAFLISVIIAYLGAQQLQQFGAEIFTVDLVAVAVLRELGVLLTSIIVAGRSGSAFAAELGVMRLNDEVDALQAMGVDYFEVLVLPRIFGLIIALPLLTILADAMGLAGGAVLSALLLDISLQQFIDRMQDALAPTTFWAGLVKAPVFAFLIAMVGTYRGLQVRDSSRELGRLTTVAVVQSIFLVILADAMFAILFVELDF